MDLGYHASMRSPRLSLAVIGGAVCTPEQGLLAHETGAEIARAGAVLLCGGRTGVMEAAARGAREAGGLTVGILPGECASSSPPNPYIELPIFTGVGQARNLVIVLSAAAVIGIGGSWGTLTEIGMALKHGRHVVLLDSWEPVRPDGRPEPRLHRARTAAEAVQTALDAIDLRKDPT